MGVYLMWKCIKSETWNMCGLWNVIMPEQLLKGENDNQKHYCLTCLYKPECSGNIEKGNCNT